ncbi:diacylglycerol kinase family protein [soil metagenome]
MIDFKHLYKAFGYSMNGIKHAFTYDQNLRIHTTIALLVIIFSIVLHVTPFEKGLLGVVMVQVIVTEMINTAIENMVDLITKEHREEARIAKDVASGMVLITAISAVIIGLLVFLPYIFRLLVTV